MTAPPFTEPEKRPNGVAITVRIFLLMIALPALLVYLFRWIMP